MGVIVTECGIETTATANITVSGLSDITVTLEHNRITRTQDLSALTGTLQTFYDCQCNIR